MSLRSLLTFAVFFIGAGCESWAQAPNSAVSPRQFAADLARLGVPGGIVVAQREIGHASPSSQSAPGDTSQKRAAAVAAVNGFNAVGSGFRATEADGFVHVRSETEPPDLRLALDRQVRVDGSPGLPAQDAVFLRVVKALSGKEPAGIIGTGTFPGPECPLRRPVRLSAGSTSATRMLDEIVKQVPGLMWFVTYDTEAPHYGLQVGLLCGDGSTVGITVFP